jgi:DNA-binding response OmpR family regulator
VDKPKRKILCVEDHQDMSALITTILSAYEVVGAYSKADALKKASDEQFDLYLLDYHLPDGTGLELCYLIRAFDSNTPVLFCTGTKTLTDGQIRMAGAQGVVYLGEGFIERLLAAVPEIFG